MSGDPLNVTVFPSPAVLLFFETGRSLYINAVDWSVVAHPLSHAALMMVNDEIFKRWFMIASLSILVGSRDAARQFV